MPMPRFTYWPLRNSSAARIASCSRVNTSGPFDSYDSYDVVRAHRAALDALLIPADDYMLHVDAGSVDVVGRHRADVHQSFHLGHGDPARHGAERVEVASCEPVLQIAVAICAPGFDEGPVRAEAVLEQVRAAREFAHFLVFRDSRA